MFIQNNRKRRFFAFAGVNAHLSRSNGFEFAFKFAIDLFIAGFCVFQAKEPAMDAEQMDCPGMLSIGDISDTVIRGCFWLSAQGRQ